MAFTPVDFRQLLSSDIWLLEQVLTLPADSDPVVTTSPEGDVRIELVDTVAMPQMQQAVGDYRSRLLPVIFVVGQKVY